MPQYSICHLIYFANGMGTTTTPGWWLDTGYNGDTIDRLQYSNAITVAEPFYRYKLISYGVDGKWYPMFTSEKTSTTVVTGTWGVSTAEFMIDSPMLFYNSTTNIGINGVVSNLYKSIPQEIRYNINVSALTQYQFLYLKGKIGLKGGFIIDSVNYYSQSLPNTDDGFYYMYLGYMYSTTALRFDVHHPIYFFKNGKLNRYTGNSDFTLSIGNTGKSIDGSKPVNFTLAEIGVLPSAGGTATGKYIFEKGYAIYDQIKASDGSTGYIKVAQLTISSSYVNVPVIIEFLQRGKTDTARLIICFTNANNTDPTLSTFVYESNSSLSAYIFKSNISTWDLYIAKSEGYDVMEIPTLKHSSYTSGIKITWLKEFAASVPDGGTWVTQRFSSSSKWSTARTITIGNTGKLIDGTANVSWSLSELGALPLTGGTISGSIKSSYVTATWLNGNLGNALIASTASPGSFVALLRGVSNNGYFTLCCYQSSLYLNYTDKETVDAGINTFTKQARLLDESGNSTFPGTVTATAFNGNATSASKLQNSRTLALAGDITGSTTFNGEGNVTIQSSLASTGVNPGTFTKVTVDAKGRVITGAQLLASDLPSHEHTYVNGFSEGSPQIIGNQTVSTNEWTGNAPTIKSLYDGLTIQYYLPYAGTSTGATLNLTLANGSTTGAIACYYRSTTVLTTHIPQYGICKLIYKPSGLGTISSAGWWLETTYHADTYDRLYYSNTVLASTTIYRYKLLMQDLTGKWYPLFPDDKTSTTVLTQWNVSSITFRIGSPILYYNAATTVSANGTLSNLYASIPFDIRYNINVASLANYVPVLLRGTIESNGGFKLNSNYYATDFPTTDDGFYYLYLGYMYSTTAMRLVTDHPVYYYKKGKICIYTSDIGSGSGIGDINPISDADLDSILI